ncbi:MAG TPA: TonB-dependent receptor plug domain-containing protein [Puia sp.]|uniref:TonB-dependent receptor n=1 Tax=Puia sp. TaxID=2045100 RepID=UPI002B918B1F|nr:TonB-dependent receptor plug domain-containing protein [Puia sp.]HVU99574.1 TonB-dependent receptor plug domain-containing protein [Puia sp.]
MKWTCFIPFLFMITAVSGQSADIAAKQLIDTTGQHIVDLKEITITHSGSAGAGSFHTLSRIDLSWQPVRSAQDLLRLVPGLFIAQHQGGGKAEQIFLRGFDADHGTDVNITADGIPVNMVSQAHGQGYADMHFIIPETIGSYDFGKGPYYADKGDFTTAGYVSYDTKKTIENSQVTIEGGQFHTGRIVTLLNLLSSAARQKGQSAYIAAEGLYSDGPFHYPEHFNRGNLCGKLITPLTRSSTLTLIGSTFASRWRAAGEIPERAVAEGYIKDRFGVIDSAQGGNTSRTNASLRIDTRLKENLRLENQAWYSRYTFDLLSNFTYFYFYPTSGDEFRQHEKRDLYGYTGRLTAVHNHGDATLTSEAGWGARYDRITPSFLAHTAGGDSILDYVQLGNIRETALNAWWSETLEKGRWLFNIGARLDYLQFVYNDSAAAKAILSPKLNIQYTAGKATQLYLKLGKGFHSNDARVVIANQGYDILPAAYGADLGINWKPAKALFINAALWYLFLKQEFTYGADLGDQAVSPGGRTRREGIDLSARYQFTPWLFGKLNVDLARPRDLDAAKGENYLPLAPTFSSTAAINFHLPSGFNGGISYRYLHDRPANEDNTLVAKGYFITDLVINYTKKRYEMGASIENLFDRSWNEGQFAYTSRLRNEPAPVDGVSFTPGTPFFARLKLTLFF